MARRLPLGPATRSALVILASIFALQLGAAFVAERRHDSWFSVVSWTALSLDALRAGRLWTPLTYMFVHSLDGWGHIFANGLMLGVAGSVVEPRLGGRRAASILVLSGLGGAAFVIVSHAAQAYLGLPSPPPVVGASGAISGLLVPFCRVLWTRHVLLFFVVRVTGKQLLLILVASNLVLGLLPVPISAAGHLGGLATGLLLSDGGTLWRDLVERLRYRRARRRIRLVHGRDPDDRPPQTH